MTAATPAVPALLVLVGLLPLLVPDPPPAAQSCRDFRGGGWASRPVLSSERPDPGVSLSPDGRRLAHVDWSTGDLALTYLPGDSTHHLTSNPSPYAGGFATAARFSPTGDRVAYTWWNPRERRAELRVISPETGSSRLIEAEPGGWIDPYGWSPDGKSILAWWDAAGGARMLALFPAAGGRADSIRSFGWRAPLAAALSPDGRFLAFDAQADPSGGRDVWVRDLRTGGERLLVRSPANDYVLDWLPSGEALLFASDRRGPADAWCLPVRDGRADGVPLLAVEEIGPAVPVGFSGADRFFYALHRSDRRVHVADRAAEGPGGWRVRRLSSPPATGAFDPAWSPDGELLAWVEETGPGRGAGTRTVVLASPSGDVLRRIVPGEGLGRTNALVWAERGTLLFRARREGRRREGVYELDLPTGDVRRLLERGSGLHLEDLQLGPDGRWLFMKEVNRTPEGDDLTRIDRIVAVDLATGRERVPYRRAHGRGAGWRLQRIALAPDGDRLAFTLEREGRGSRLFLLRVPDGEPAEVEVSGKMGTRAMAWSGDGRSLWMDAPATADPEEGPGRAFRLIRFDPESGRAVETSLAGPALTDVVVAPSARRLAFTAGVPSYQIRALEPGRDDGSP